MPRPQKRSRLQSTFRRVQPLSISCAALLGLAAPALTATNSWLGATDAQWATGTNWGLGVKPTLAEDVLFPTTLPGSGGTITLGTGETALSLTFRNTYTLTGGTLALGTGGLITVAPTFTATINSQLTGSNGLTLASSNNLTAPDDQVGGGTLVLGGTNDYSGMTTVNAGILSFSSSANLGNASATNTIALGGGTLRSTGTLVDLGVTRSIAVSGTGSTIEVGGTNELIVSGALSSGAGNTLTKTGSGTLTLSGTEANATAGNIAMNGGVLQLNKTGVNAIGSGGVTITTSTTTGTVRLLASDQIADNASVNLSASGGMIARLDLNGFNETVGNITVASNTNGSATISTGATGVLTLNGDLTMNNNRGATGNTGREVLITGTGTYGTVTPSGTLDLGGATRTITIGGVTSASNTSATIETVIRNGGIIKQGANALLLRGTNTYSGGTTINAGRIVAYNDSALGTGAINVNANGELSAANITFSKNVTLNGGALSGAAGTTSAFSGTIDVTANSRVLLRDAVTSFQTTLDARDLKILGEIKGSGNLAITAPSAATLVVGGDNQTYTGQFSIGENAAVEILHNNALGAIGAIGSGRDTVVLAGGSLRLANNITVGNEGLTLSGHGQTMNDFGSDGALRNLSGVNTYAGIVNLAASATIQSDGGNLTLSNPTSITGTGTDLIVRGLGEVTINGTVNLGGGTFTKLGDGTLTFASNLTSLPVTNFVNGTLGFTGSQSFGASTIPDGLAYRFNSDPGAGVSITAPANTRVIAGYAANQALLSRITTNSAGTLALRFDSSNALDFSAHPGLSLGAAGTNLVTYSGVLTPGADGYRLGGGLGRLIVRSQLTGNNAVAINGDVRLVGKNTFTGGVSINTGGQLAMLDNTNLGDASNEITLNGGTLQLVQVGPSATSLFLQFGNPLSSQARTLTVGPLGGRIDVPATTAGGSGVAFTGVNSLRGGTDATLTKSELGILFLLKSNDFAGHLVIAPNGNQFELRSDGALPNISSVTINTGGYLNIDNNNRVGSRQFESIANSDMFNDAATINLLGGRLMYIGRNVALSGTSSREIFGTINIGLGQSEILSNRSGAGGADLVITNLAREYGGGTVRFTAGNTLGSGGDNGRTRIMGLNGVDGEPNTGTFLGGWALYNSSDFATYIKSAIGAAGGVVRYGFGSGAPAYATTFASGNVTNISAALTLPAGNTSTLALRLSQGAAQTLAFTNASDILFLESGGLLSDGQNFSRAIGSSTVRGNLTAGPVGATTPQELFLHNNSNTMTIFANVIDNPGGGSVRVVKDLDGAVTLDGISTYSGGTAVLRGTVTGNRTGSLGTGAVLVKNAQLNLATFGSSSGANVPANEPVVKLIDQSTLTLTGSSGSASAYTAAGDRFYISAGSTIYANSPGAGLGFNSLTRVSAYTGGGQIILEPDSIIQHNVTNAPDQGAGILTINGLGTRADLYFGIGNTAGANSTLTIGGGTPWKGLSSDRGTRTWHQGTIYANSDFYLQGLTRDNGQAIMVLGSTDAGVYNIVNTSGKPIDAFIQGTVQLNDDDGPSLPGDLTFVVMPGSLFQPNRTASLGFGSQTAKVVVQAGGTLDPGSYVGVNTSGFLYGLQSLPQISPLNGTVTVNAGGRFLVNDVSGIGSALPGSYTIRPDGILELGHTAAFRGSGDMALGGFDDTGFIMPGQFVFEPGAIIRFTTSNVTGFEQFVNNAPNGQRLVYEIVNGNRQLTSQSSFLIEPGLGIPIAAPENFTVGNGGILTNDSADRIVDGNGGGRLILKDGAILAPTTQTLFYIGASTELEAGAAVTIGALGSIDGNEKLGVLQLSETNNLKMGAGSKFVLLNGTTLSFSAPNVYPDTANLDLPHAVTGIPSGNGSIPGSGTSLLFNVTGTETIAKLTGVGRVQSNQSSAPTLQVGYGLAQGDDFTFAGEFSNAGGQNVNLNKIGDSTFFITGPGTGNTSLGTMSVYGGAITLKDAGSTNFLANIGKGGTLVLDNSGTALDDRLGRKTLGVTGGKFLLIGNATTPVTETIGTLTTTQFPGSVGHFNVQPGAATTTLTFDTIQEYQNGDRRATFVFRGAGMAGLPGTYDAEGVYVANPANPTNGLITANNPNFTSRGSVNQAGNVITGAVGTPVVAFRPDMLGSLDPNSVWGDRFVTQDNSSTGFRLLADSEYASTIVSDNYGGYANVRLTANASIEGDTRLAGLTFGPGNTTLSMTGQMFAANSPSRLYFSTPAILVEAGGSATIDGADTYLDRAGSAPWYFHTFGDLTLNVGLVGSNGFVKNGPGTLTFGADTLGLSNSLPGGAYGGNFWGGTHTINGGTVIMNGSTTFLRGQNANSGPHVVVNDGILNINGYDQIYNRLDSASPLANTGGTITSPLPAVLSNYGGGNFSGQITGAITYNKSYNTTQTFTSEQTYSGPTIIDGGTLVLNDQGKLTNSSEITLKYAALVLDNSNLSATTNRIRSDINIYSLGGTFELKGRLETNVTQDLATTPGTAFHLMGRDTTIRLDAGAFGSTTLNIGNMTRGDEMTTLAFTTANGTFGYPVPGKQDLHVYFNLNGATPTLTNGILGGWAVVNSSFASYYPAAGVGEVGDIASGFPSVVGNTITTWNATTNASFSGSPSGNLNAGTEVNTLRMLDSGANPTVAFNSGGTLKINSGGILTNQNRGVAFGTSTARGTLTSGSPFLYAWIFQNTTTINSVITNDGANPIGLIKLQGGGLTLTGANTYTGDTYAYGGTLTLSTPSANQTTTVAIPGNLIAAGGSVTETAAGQIASTAKITAAGGSLITLIGGNTSTYRSFTLENDGGGTSNNRPQITATGTGGTVRLTDTNAITVIDNALTTTPTLSVNLGTIQFAGAAGTAQIIHVDGAANEPLALVFNPNVGSIPTGVTGGGLVKTGDGMLALGGSGANQFGVAASGPATEVFNIQQGIVRIDHANALGNNHAITNLQTGTVLLGRNISSTTAGILGSLNLSAGTVLGPTEGGATFGASTTDPTLLATINVLGNVNFWTTDYFLPVTQGYTMIINSKLIGSGNINVVGPAGTGITGVLRLGNANTGTAAGANTYSGTITLNRSTQLLAQTTGSATTGSVLGTANIILKGGELRLRDNGTASNGTIAYGNHVTLEENSAINVDRIGANSNNMFLLGTLTLASGTLDLNVSSGNSFDVGFAQIAGPGTLRKEGTADLFINGYAAGFSGNFEIAGQQGLSFAMAQGLNFNAAVNNINRLVVGGNYTPLTGKTVNFTDLVVSRNTGVVNGYNGVTTGAAAGAISIPNGAVVNVTNLENHGIIGSTGTNGGTLTATNIRGSGWYQTVGQPLVVNGNLNDAAGVFRVAGGTTANDVVTLNATNNALINRVEIQSGTLRITDASPTFTPLGSNIQVMGYPASTPGPNQQAVAAPGGVLQLDTTAGGNTIQHVGDISNSGTVKVTGTGVTEIQGSIVGTAVSYVAGLLEGRIATGTLDTSDTRPGNPGNFGIKLEPRMAQSSLVTGNALTGWTDNTTWIYTGQFYDADGIFAFAESLDDRVLISIDGVNVLINNSSAQISSTAYSVGQADGTANQAGANLGTPTTNFGMGVNGDGWHSIEIRITNGTGGAGPSVRNGFTTNYGLGYNPTGPTGLDGTLYQRPIDPGDGSLFRTAVGGKGNIVVDPGAELRVQSFSMMSSVTINGGSSVESALILTAPGASDTDAFTANNLAYLEIPTGHTVTTGKFDVGAVGEFYKAGEGTMIVNGAVNLASTSKFTLEEGMVIVNGTKAVTDSPDAQIYVDGDDAALVVNGSISGKINVGQIFGGGLLAGTGLVGDVEVSDGRLAPGNPVSGTGLGVLSTGTVTLNSNAVFELQLQLVGHDRLNVTGLVNLDGELKLTLASGFTPSWGNTFTIVTNDGDDVVSAVGFGFTNASIVAEFSTAFPTVYDNLGNAYLLSFTGEDGFFNAAGGNDVVLMAVPEPGSTTMLALGLGSLLGLRRFRSRSRSKQPC